MRRVRGFEGSWVRGNSNSLISSFSLEPLNPGVLNGNIELEIAARKGKKFQTKIKGAK